MPAPRALGVTFAAINALMGNVRWIRQALGDVIEELRSAAGGAFG